jgi:iron complex transport system substrate-binding protein
MIWTHERGGYLLSSWRAVVCSDAPRSMAARWRVTWRIMVVVWAIVLAPASVPAETRTFVDSVGRPVIVPAPLKRLISLAPSVTEILFALDLDEQIIAVTDFCDYPAEALGKTKVGTMYQPNIEQIVSLQPDLVITAVGASKKETVLHLERLAVPVYVLNPRNMDEIFTAITLMGAVVDREDAAHDLVRKLQARLITVQGALFGRRPVRTLYLLWYQPLMTVGSGSFLHEIITRAGGENLSKDALLDYPTYSLEQVITAAPEVIVLNTDSAPFQRLVAEQPQRWSHLPAVRNGRLYVIDTGLLNRPSPRSVEAVEVLARLLHPEVFASAPQHRR